MTASVIHGFAGKPAVLKVRPGDRQGPEMLSGQSGSSKPGNFFFLLATSIVLTTGP